MPSTGRQNYDLKIIFVIWSLELRYTNSATIFTFCFFPVTANSILKVKNHTKCTWCEKNKKKTKKNNKKNGIALRIKKRVSLIVQQTAQELCIVLYYNHIHIKHTKQKLQYLAVSCKKSYVHL